MKIINFECKAKVDDTSFYEAIILQQPHRFAGTDIQTDTYFNVPKGRLKLREGNIENALIQYERSDTADAKVSKVVLYKHSPDAALKEILTTQFGIKTVVMKERRIYFIDNVKFHFDRVEQLGCFLEIEAISEAESVSEAALQHQCEHYLQLLQISRSQLVAASYSDLLLRKKC